MPDIAKAIAEIMVLLEEVKRSKGSGSKIKMRVESDGRIQIEVVPALKLVKTEEDS
jgi:hypothetical protein